MLVEQVYSLVSIAGGEYEKAMVLQHDFSYSQADGLVVDTEHRLLARCGHPFPRFFQCGFNSGLRTVVDAGFKNQSMFLTLTVAVLRQTRC
jgi:hypothetical protein